MSSEALISFAVLFGVIALLAMIFVLVFNSIVRAGNEVRNAASQVEVQLQMRHDLVPNLVNVVAGYANHERTTLESVTRARAGAIGMPAGTSERFAQENLLTRALVDLRLVAERYPQLQADTEFLRLHDSLTRVEGLIAGARQYYNDALMRLENLTQQFPGIVVATATGRTSVPPYFHSDDAAAKSPVVSFDMRT